MDLNEDKSDIMMVTMLCVCIVCISDTVDEDDDLYDFVEDEENEGDEIYEDLMRTNEPPETVSEPHTASYLKQKGRFSSSFGNLEALQVCRGSYAVQKCITSRVCLII